MAFYTQHTPSVTGTAVRPAPKTRVLDFEGSENFRDMGGYPTKDGRRVKSGCLYRSSALHHMTPGDIERFKSLHIDLIFDYRDAMEAQSEPNPEIEGVRQLRVSANDSQDFIWGYLSPEYRRALSPQGLTEYYRALALGNPAYQQLVKAVLRPETRRMVHHCAAGKDRTGVGSAILLMALGVSRESIMEDYLLSNALLPRYAQRQLALVQKHYSAQELAYFKQTLGVREEYLQTFFDSIDREYPDEEQFLLYEFGLTQPLRQALQEKFLEC